MLGRHIIQHLSAYEHGELTAAEKQRVELHLQTCAKCRAAHEEIRMGARFASALSLTTAPDSVWNEVQRGPQETTRHRWILQVSLAAVAVIAVAVGVFFFMRTPHPAGPSWEVSGLPGTSRLRPGEVLQTDSSSEAQIKIANIGQLSVDRNTRIRLLLTQSDQHRIALDRGKVEATTWAPPRLFIVETPSANAVDLGCKYTLEVEEDGSSLLHVTLGLVALERGKGETIVPAGAFCRTRSGAGPGTPFFEDSSAAFQSALSKVDSLKEGPDRSKQLEIVLREAHIRDALSLWYLIPRLDESSRGLVFDRLARMLPPPPEVTREGIAKLDPKMLDAWKSVVSQLWQ